MIDYNSIRNTILSTYFKLRELSGNKTCIIKRIVKQSGNIFDSTGSRFNIPKEFTIEVEVPCFVTANPTIFLEGNLSLGAEYKTRIYILIEDIQKSKLETLIKTDEIYSDFENNKMKKYQIRDFSVLFDCLYMITLQ